VNVHGGGLVGIGQVFVYWDERRRRVGATDIKLWFVIDKSCELALA